VTCVKLAKIGSVFGKDWREGLGRKKCNLSLGIGNIKSQFGRVHCSEMNLTLLVNDPAMSKSRQVPAI